MMSQMSHIISITQINSTIESHETDHMWADITYKIPKIMDLMNLCKDGYWEWEIMHKNYCLTEKFHEQYYLILQGNLGAYKNT